MNNNNYNNGFQNIPKESLFSFTNFCCFEFVWLNISKFLKNNKIIILVSKVCQDTT
jgi:hypothetical protein